MILFIGDKPSKRMKPGARPFEGAACEFRLKEWISVVRGSNEYTIINSKDWPNWLLHKNIEVNNAIIALGNNASKALGKIPHFKLPHPSGRNRQINDKEFIAKKLQECREWLKR